MMSVVKHAVRIMWTGLTTQTDSSTAGIYTVRFLIFCYTHKIVLIAQSKDVSLWLARLQCAKYMYHQLPESFWCSGVTRCGNWWHHHVFFLKKLTTFLKKYKKVKKGITVCRQACHHRYGNSHAVCFTQCYLPPGRGDNPVFTPAEAGTRFSDPGGMQGWVDPGSHRPLTTTFLSCRLVTTTTFPAFQRRSSTLLCKFTPQNYCYSGVTPPPLDGVTRGGPPPRPAPSPHSDATVLMCITAVVYTRNKYLYFELHTFRHDLLKNITEY